MRNLNDDNIVVSVCMTAYNQAKFIIDAIEGVLMQNTNFKIELLIGEDFSSMDNTLEICREYERNYPEVIHVLHDGTNHGMVANEQRLMDIAKGKYIAFCEADDYWIDPLKLQRQVDMLESNSYLSACASQSRVINGIDKNHFYLLNNKFLINQEITLIDLLVGNADFQTASFLFRAKNIKGVPPLPISINGWDRAIFMLNAYKGNIYWFMDEMVVYRKNELGISSWVTYDMMRRDFDMINWFKSIDIKFPLNELKAHVYYAIMLNSVKLTVFDLFKCYISCLYYIKKNEIEMVQLRTNAKGCFVYRLPKITRRIMKKMKLL